MYRENASSHHERALYALSVAEDKNKPHEIREVYAGIAVANALLLIAERLRQPSIGPK